MKKVFSLIVLLTAITTLVSCQKAYYDIDSREDLVIGLEAAYAPFNWLATKPSDFTHPISNQSGNHVDGYDVMVAKRVAELMDKKLVIKAISWIGLIPALKSGEIDGIIAGMSPTSERAKQISFTNDYYRSEVVMVVNKQGTLTNSTSIDDFAGKRIVAQRGTLYDGLIDQIPNVIHQTPADSYGILATAVMSGTSDGFTCELPVALAMVASQPDAFSIVYFTEKGFETAEENIAVSIGLRKNDTQLLDALNKALEEISQEQRSTWMEEAISRNSGL